MRYRASFFEKKKNLKMLQHLYFDYAAQIKKCSNKASVKKKSKNLN